MQPEDSPTPQSQPPPDAATPSGAPLCRARNRPDRSHPPSLAPAAVPPDPARELVACARYSARRFVCLDVSGALLVIQAVMLALGFDGIMRHMLTVAAWLLPDEWG